MRRLNQHLAQQIITSLNQSARRSLASRRIVSRAHRTKMGELLARAKPIKASDDYSHRDCCDNANAGLRQQLLDYSIIGNLRLHYCSSVGDLFGKELNRVVMIL